MTQWTKGDILAADIKCEALVNSVNCVGIMGRGIALQFKKAFPDNFEAYAKACKQNEIQPGRMFVFEEKKHLPPLRYIINFPTKRHWRGKSRIEDIKNGLQALKQEIQDRNIHSIAIPPLGAGLGGLDWENQVRPLIQSELGSLTDVEIIVFEPGSQPLPDEPENHSTDVPSMTPGRAALIGLIDRYLAGLMDISVTLLEVHKLLYFMQEAGEPLRLKYSKHLYGPYAENLRHVLERINNHLISVPAINGDNPRTEIELVPGAISDAENFLKKQPETQSRFNKVVDLVQGFESSFGLELLATVHWVVKREDTSAECEEVVKKVYAWNPRKKEFSPRQIGIALQRLEEGNWI